MGKTEYGNYVPQAVIGSGYTILGFTPDALDVTTALLIVKVRTVLWYAYWKGQRDFQKICTQCLANSIRPSICRTVITSDDALLRIENIFAVDGDPYVRLPSLNATEETWYLFGGSEESFEKAMESAASRKISIKKETFTSYAMTAVDKRYRETRQMREMANSAQGEYRIHNTSAEKASGSVLKNGRKKTLTGDGQKFRSALLEAFRRDTGDEIVEDETRMFHMLPLDIGDGEEREMLNGSELYQLSDGLRAVLIPKADIDKTGIIHAISVMPGKKYYTFHMNRRGVYLDEKPYLITGAELIEELQKPDLREYNKELLGRQLKLSSLNEKDAIYESESGIFRLTRNKGCIQVETFDEKIESTGKDIHYFRKNELIPTFEEFLKKTKYGKSPLKQISQTELENRYKKAHKRRLFWNRSNK